MKNFRHRTRAWRRLVNSKKKDVAKKYIAQREEIESKQINVWRRGFTKFGNFYQIIEKLVAVKDYEKAYDQALEKVRKEIHRGYMSFTYYCCGTKLDATSMWAARQEVLPSPKQILSYCLYQNIQDVKWAVYLGKTKIQGVEYYKYRIKCRVTDEKDIEKRTVDHKINATHRNLSFYLSNDAHWGWVFAKEHSAHEGYDYWYYYQKRQESYRKQLDNDLALYFLNDWREGVLPDNVYYTSEGKRFIDPSIFDPYEDYPDNSEQYWWDEYLAERYETTSYDMDCV